MLRSLNEHAIQMKAKETSNFVESLRAIQSMKLFNHENERESQWLNRFADSVNADVRLETRQRRLRGRQSLLVQRRKHPGHLLGGTSRARGTFTIGMIFAFITYKQQFISKANLLVEKALDFGIVGLHLERLSDIALTPVEAGHDRPLLARPISGAIEVRNLSFRYAESEEFVLQNVNFSIGAGHVRYDQRSLRLRQNDFDEDPRRAAAAYEWRGAG